MSGDDLPADRANRIADAVEDIERNVTRLRTFQELSRGEYSAADEQDRRDAIERKFEKLAEAVVDIASELCKQERGTTPDHRKATITALEDEGLITICCNSDGFIPRLKSWTFSCTPCKPPCACSD